VKTSQVTPIALLTTLVAGIVATGFWIGSIFAPTGIPAFPAASSVATESATESADDTATDTAAESASDTELLQYLIEEEKLAYDVYVTLGDKWGSAVFTNVSASEVTHQDRVAGLLDAAGIDDPRSSTVGEFVNPELQALYDQLIAQGSVSQTAAFEVGVAIEELDIADITEMLTSVTDPEIVSVLKSLRSASENHLAAFQRQL
jgi:hypothetical protein